MKIRTRTENEEGMRQTILRALNHQPPREELPPAGETIDEDIAFAAVAEESRGLQDFPSGLLAPSPRPFNPIGKAWLESAFSESHTGKAVAHV